MALSGGPSRSGLAEHIEASNTKQLFAEGAMSCAQAGGELEALIVQYGDEPFRAAQPPVHRTTWV